MSKASDAANAVVGAAIQICEMHGVYVTRMQSRVVMVPGAAGRIRPMFFGKWKDEFGHDHNSGMADLLARPAIPISRFAPIVPSELYNSVAQKREVGKAGGVTIMDYFITVPLWIECKAGTGKPSFEQMAFKHYVESNGEHYVLVQNDVRPLMQWFDKHGVRK